MQVLLLTATSAMKNGGDEKSYQVQSRGYPTRAIKASEIPREPLSEKDWINYWRKYDRLCDRPAIFDYAKREITMACDVYNIHGYGDEAVSDCCGFITITMRDNGRTWSIISVDALPAAACGIWDEFDFQVWNQHWFYGRPWLHRMEKEMCDGDTKNVAIIRPQFMWSAFESYVQPKNRHVYEPLSENLKESGKANELYHLWAQYKEKREQQTAADAVKYGSKMEADDKVITEEQKTEERKKRNNLTHKKQCINAKMSQMTKEQLKELMLMMTKMMEG